MRSKKQDPVRILHVVGGMDRGGVETWLMHVLRHIDRERFRMDFLVHTIRPCAYDEEIRSLGSKIIPCLSPHRPWQYARNFRQTLKRHGPYDIVHSHVHHFSGYVVSLAHRAGIPIRITHSHSDTSLTNRSTGMFRRGYLLLTEHLIRRHATISLACSRKAAAALYGAGWEGEPRCQVLYCAIDLEPFKWPVDRPEVRCELNIPMDAFVLGHVGGFREVKNHGFLLDIAVGVAKREPNMRLLLIGDGPLRSTIECKVAALDMKEKVIFAGWRSDVPRLMKGAMDVFVLPSFYEGLSLVTIEAQAAGIPVIISDVVPEEVDCLHSLVTRMNLANGPYNWTDKVLQVQTLYKNKNEGELKVIEDSPFNICDAINKLAYLYGSVL